MLRPLPIGPVPEDTTRVAQAVFPAGHPYLRLADEVGDLFSDEIFAPLFPTHGQPAFAPWRLALVTILQFAEGLSDIQAAHALRTRIDWKYVARLELTDRGVDGSVLSEFRSRLRDGAAETLLLDRLLAWCRERKLLRIRGRQRTDSTHVLAAVRALNRIELVGETLRHALNSLAVVAPEWLQVLSQPEWLERYARRAEDTRLPKGQEAREALALTIGADGNALLSAAYAPDAPTWLREVPAVETLRRVWVQNFSQEGTILQWRTDRQGIPSSADFISSPYDPDAHYAKKHTTQWVGYKLHVTETCEADCPRLITQVESASGPAADSAATPTIHARLQSKDLLPGVHLVDTGYLDGPLLADSRRDYGIDLYGPTRPDYKWQARAGEGFDAAHFAIDWEREQATCPAGKTSISWTPTIDKRKNRAIKVKFSAKDCGPCPHRTHCIHSIKRYQRRTITLRPQEAYEALQAGRARETTAEFVATYAKRAGIEGTLSRGIRRCRLRRTRYIGLARTHLAHVLTAVAINFLRLGEWFTDVPPAKTRRSPYAQLMAGAVAA
ncbi:MAG: IS1182 family transposase [Ktedonobacterales bacterium]